MKFNPDNTLTYEQAVTYLFQQLGTHKIMALASSVNDYVMVRNVSCLFYDEKIYFKTDRDFRKTAQLFENSRTALCWSGVSVEGEARNKGLVVEEPGRRFEKGYREYLWNSYNKYSHEETEIIIEVTPDFVEIWDTNDEGIAYQIFIDFKRKTAVYQPYDQK